RRADVQPGTFMPAIWPDERRRAGAAANGETIKHRQIVYVVAGHDVVDSNAARQHARKNGLVLTLVTGPVAYGGLVYRKPPIDRDIPPKLECRIRIAPAARC